MSICKSFVQWLMYICKIQLKEAANLPFNTDTTSDLQKSTLLFLYPYKQNKFFHHIFRRFDKKVRWKSQRSQSPQLYGQKK